MQSTIENNLGYVKTLQFQNEDCIINPQESNASEGNRIKFITYIKSLIRIKNIGKPIPDNLIYNKLMEEMALNPSNPHLKEGSPSRLFEFIPVQLRYKQDCKNNLIHIKLRGKMNSCLGLQLNFDKFKELFLKFSFSHMIAPNEYILNTNLRTCINGGIPYEYIPYNTPEETKSFKAIEVYCPTFAILKIFEHTQLSKEYEYDKNLSEDDYWYSEKLTTEDIEQVKSLPTNDIIPFLKSKGINRDIYSSGLYGWRKRKILIAGWDDRITWRSLFLDKNASTSDHINFTPKEISAIVRAIKEIIYPKLEF